MQCFLFFLPKKKKATLGKYTAHLLHSDSIILLRVNHDTIGPVEEWYKIRALHMIAEGLWNLTGDLQRGLSPRAVRTLPLSWQVDTNTYILGTATQLSPAPNLVMFTTPP